MAYVQVYPEGSTAPGWGRDAFMPKYKKGAFSERRAVTIYERHTTPFALVMRSVRMICIDIDGKNNGLDSASALFLPPTLAETSKSGNGYHLFYTVDDEWDDEAGFGAVNDRIDFRPGIDIRGTGCVYHYPRQQWNARKPVDLPDHILEMIKQKKYNLEGTIQKIEALSVSTDPDDKTELLMMQENVKSRLTTTIPAGKRNNTLFAIGAEMQQHGILGWEQQILDRAIEVGLDQDEAEKLVRNVERYGK